MGQLTVSMASRLPLLPTLLVLSAAPLPGAPATREVLQSPPYTITPVGGSISITCSTHGFMRGVYLKRSSWPEASKMIYYEDEMNPTVDPWFENRVTFSGKQHNLTITMHHLKPADTGTYFCEAIMESDKSWGSGTLVVVTDTPFQALNTCQETELIYFIVLVVLGMGFVLIALGLGTMCVLRRTQIKKLCWARDRSSEHVVYEDMSYSRRDTMSTLNHYQ